MRTRTLLTAAALTAAALTFFAACDDNGDGERDNASKLYINGRDRETTNKSATGALTVREILRYDTLWLTGTKIGNPNGGCSGFHCRAEGTIDTINQRLIRDAGDVKVYDDFCDFVIIHWTDIGRDTLAYIPNDTVRAAYERIVELREQGRWNELYEVFQNAFVFYPCTAEEYKELEAKGLN